MLFSKIRHWHKIWNILFHKVINIFRIDFIKHIQLVLCLLYSLCRYFSQNLLWKMLWTVNLSWIDGLKYCIVIRPLEHRLRLVYLESQAGWKLWHLVSQVLRCPLLSLRKVAGPLQPECGLFCWNFVFVFNLA